MVTGKWICFYAVRKVTDNVKVLCAVGDFGNGTFNLPPKPDRSTNVQLTTLAPIAQNTLLWAAVL